MRPFRKLAVWQKAHSLTLEIWAVTAEFPPEEKFGLTSQMRRSARSIPANLAEGCGRRSQKAFAYHIDIACGSSSELEYDLELSRSLGFLDAGCFETLLRKVVEVRKMLLGLARAAAP